MPDSQRNISGGCHVRHPSGNETIMKVLLLNFLIVGQALGWGGNNDKSSDTTVYGNVFARDWLYDSKSISIKLEGCAYGVVESGGEGDKNDNNNGCLESSSEDGTYGWYQMANCRRAQAVFSVYSSSSSSTGCSSSNFKETFVTQGGLGEFVYYLQNYDANSPFGDYGYDDDDYAYDDDGGDEQREGGNQYDNLPMCEQKDGYYVGIGCADDGTFSLQYFNDQYCLQPSGSTYSSMRQLNRALRTYKRCSGVYYSGGDSSLIEYLVAVSDSCSSLDSSLCTDNSAMEARRKSTGHSSSKKSRNEGGGFASKTWVTKLKYVVGGMLLLASFVMFTGILFTNRRRRRALMQRKYRQKRSDDRSRKSKSGSKSRRKKSRDSRSRESKGRRSRPREEEDAPVSSNGGDEGVFA